MKKVISLLLSVVMLISCVGGIQLTAGAADYTTLSTDVPLNGQWSGDYWITETSNEHWYRITIPSDGYLELRLRSYSCTRLQLYTYDLSKEIIDYYDLVARGSSTAPQTSTCDRVLSSGTYYGKVTGDAGKYNMYASYVSYGVNDYAAYSYDSPQDLSANFSVTGAITETDGEDWFRIQVPANACYTFKIVSYDRNRVQLYNYDLSKEIIDYYDLVASGSQTAPATAVNNKILSPGTYYAKVTGNTGKYTFLWYELTPENCTHEFQTSTTSSTCRSYGYTTYTCKICGYSYNDNYKPLSSHSFSTSTVYPTYLSGGYTVYTCRNCGYTYNDKFTAKLKVTKPSISSIKKGKKKFTAYFSNYYGLDGIQVQYSTSKKFTKSKTKTVSTAKSTKTVKNLKSKKKYYVRVRGYKKVGSKKVYSSWSKVQSVKTK